MITEFLFSESQEAQKEILDAALKVDATKEDIAKVATDKAEEIAEAVDNAVEAHTGEPLSEEKFNEVMLVVAQDIYTNVLGGLASIQSMYAMDDLLD